MNDTTMRLPIIKLWKQVLVPLQGDISDVLADRLREQVLETIRDSDAQGLIIDVTGVWMVDSHLCSVLSNMAGAARLMGTDCVICGMSAEIALTLQAMDIDLSAIRTALSLEEAFALFGIHPAAKKDDRRNSGDKRGQQPSGGADGRGDGRASANPMAPSGVVHGRFGLRT